MKTCPTCGNTFSRRVSFCFDDGTPLVGEEEPVVAAKPARSSTPAVPAPRRGRSVLARRRGVPAPAPEHTEADADFHPSTLRPLDVGGQTPRPAPAPVLEPDVTPAASAPRERTPAPVVAQPTPTPVAAPIVNEPPATPTPPAPLPKASEAPTLIMDPEDEEEGGWGMMLTILLGVGGVVLVGLLIAVGLMVANQGGPDADPDLAVVTPQPTVPQPVAPVPVAPQPVAVPEPVVEPDTDVPSEGTEPEGTEPTVQVDEPTVQATEPEPSIDPRIISEPVAPSPEPQAVVAPPSPETSPWTEVGPEPSAPEPVASAPLTVNSTPSGAAVKINGVVLGATPFRMTMPGGEYPVELTLEGYESVQRSVSIADAGGAAVSVTLSPIARSGPILVTLGGWEGAELLVDGQLLGTLPARIDSIVEGSHTFTVRRGDEQQQFTRNVSLNDGGMTVLTLGG